MKAIELLEKLQSSYPYPKVSEEDFVFSFMKLQKQMSQTLGVDLPLTYKEYEKMFSTPPTEKQNPLTYSLLYDIIRAFSDLIEEKKEEFSKQYNVELKKFPVFGTITMGEFSAQAISCGELDESLMLFSDGLFGFANLISKLVATAYPMKNDAAGSYSSKKEDILENISKNNLLIARFLDLMLAYMLCNDAHRAKQYIIEKEYFNFSEIIRDSFEYFVVAHEYAHFSLGHLSAESNKKLFGQDCKDVEKIIFNWAQEIEADKLGAVLTLHVMTQRGYDVFISGMGIWVCLTVLDYIEKLRKVLEGQETDEELSMTHPPISIRKEAFLTVLPNEKEAREFFSSIDVIFDELWKYFIRFFNSLKQMLSKQKISLKDLNYATISNLLYKFNFTMGNE